MKKSLLIILIIIITGLGVEVPAKAGIQAQNDIEMAKSRNGIPSSRYQVCRDLMTLLKTPENSDFVDAPVEDHTDFRMFKVPKGEKDFRLPKWQQVTKKDFENALPEYFYRVENAEKNGTEPKNFRMTKLDGLNNGKTVPIYAVDLSSTHTQTLMTDNQGHGRWWNDNNEAFEIFLYKGRVFLLGHGHSIDGIYPDSVVVIEPRIIGRKIQSPTVCYLHLYSNDKQRRARDARIEAGEGPLP